MANRLEKEDSPYLQQYKNNPVDWWPWCDEAFEKAQKENKAIFISIGYSSCHWCHVMEKEVFENVECAAILNDNFIAIKVDREERPDVDKYYQEVYRLLNNRVGGWPASIFCTPQNKPFFARTYLPADSIPGSNEGMGFKEISNIVAQKVKENDTKLFENAEEIESFLKKIEHPKEATVLKEEFYKNFMLQAEQNFDKENGGFADKPKFPHASTLSTLVTIAKLYKNENAKNMLFTTLDAMAKGGIYDLVESGFYRYSVDAMWHVPHFEKMLYDTAMLIGVYADAYLLSNNTEYLHVAKSCADFWHNFMSEDNLFYSASDADSNGAEGDYYLYTYKEVIQTLESAGYTNPAEICQTLSITPDGNFQGKNIIRFTNEKPEYFEDVKTLLEQLRAKRNYPFIDKKIQTSWSSMMIHALLKLGAIDNSYGVRAIKNLDALLETMYLEGKLYHTTLIHKTPKVEAFLEDYAFLTRALLSAYKFNGDELYLIHAQRFANKALEEFYSKGMWNFSSNKLVIKADITDNTYTSAVSVMVEVLLSLGYILEDEKYTHFAFKTMEYNSYEVGRKPIYSPHMLTQIIRYVKGERIIKSNLQNLQNASFELAKLPYPFVSHKVTDDTEFLICAEKNCFANTANVNELAALLLKSF
ncbi:MAG: thioredoxin domain-containing protein [Campylobacterales bacterium]|nr:thioredoxin domain-containing protein [Campylobacterales bacterium]